MINGHVYCIDIHSLEFYFYHDFIANDYKSIKLFVYIRGNSTDIHTYFICVYRSLNGVGTLQKPDSNLTFSTPFSHIMFIKLWKRYKKGKNTNMGT